MNSHLLDIVALPPGRGKAPLYVELPVNPDTGPFIVSGTRGVLPVYRTTNDGRIRAAVRVASPDLLFREVISAFVPLSVSEGWGAVFPVGGENDARARMVEFGFDEVDVVKPEDADWVPPGHVILLPRDRAYVGTLVTFRSGAVAMVVHNPSRGICVVLPSTPAEGDATCVPG